MDIGLVGFSETAENSLGAIKTFGTILQTTLFSYCFIVDTFRKNLKFSHVRIKITFSETDKVFSSILLKNRTTNLTQAFDTGKSGLQPLNQERLTNQFAHREKHVNSFRLSAIWCNPRAARSGFT